MKFKGNWKVNQENFKKACTEIVKSGLKDFKRHPAYIGYIGNDVRKWHVANAFHDYITKEYPKLLETDFTKNDQIGNPIIHEVGNIKASAGTLRFLKVCGDINRYFGGANGLDICEIGSGYGGQCLVTNLVYDVKSYTLIDIPESLEIAKKYLSNFDVKKRCLSSEKIVKRKYDLVISDYCLSELDIEGIEFYLDNVIEGSKYGYFTISSAKAELLYDMLEERYDEVKMMPEEPATSQHKNIILICKR